MTKKAFLFNLGIYIFFSFLVIATSSFPFFWDTIQLASKHAHFFYETNFRSIILPNEIDSGHIPSLGIYLALIWKLFGKSLFISHIAMLPFVIGIVYQSIQITNRLFSKQWRIVALLFLLLDTTLLAQCTLVSPDVILIFFFLMAIHHLFSKNKLWYSIALLGMVLASTRGMMCVTSLFLVNFIQNFTTIIHLRKLKWFKYFLTTSLESIKNIVIPYIPSTIIAGSFLAWHYDKTGWIGYHKDMPWASLFEPVKWTGMFHNIFILAWRFVDMGRLFVWLTGMVCLWHYLKYKPKLHENTKTLILLCIFITLALSQAAIFHKGLSCHRYFLPIYLLYAILVSYYLLEYINNLAIKKAVIALTLLGMLSGNFWVYPDRIAKGWDSTLAYIPYFPMRQKMLDFMQSNDISLNETGTSFPNSGKLKYIDLSESSEEFAVLNFKTNRFIFYSNICNDFTDGELDTLNNKWIKVKEFSFLQTRITLFKNPF